MLFTSLYYILFLVLVVIIYYQLPQKYRWIVLLSSSYIFYSLWNPVFILILLFITISVYFGGIIIQEKADKKRKKKVLFFVVLLDLLVLFFFKYFNFFSRPIIGLLQLAGIHFDHFQLDILLPIGISFYTFQALGYLIDVSRGTISAEKHFGKLALFVSFFPQLFSGPIERGKNMLPQFNKLNSQFDSALFSSGVKLILFGFFKKVVIADNLSIVVNSVYLAPNENSGFQYVIATILFAWQIYFDFSGYTDMAIGTARIFGIRIMSNFNQPYLATSIADFWKRWHISLSTWFRDYVFLPLAFRFSSKMPAERYFGISSNLIIYILTAIITFLLTGLWHGANWTFVIWGLIHGSLLAFEFSTRKFRKRILSLLKLKKSGSINVWLSRIITFIFLCFTWIFFKSASLNEAGIILHKIFSSWNSLNIPFDNMELNIIAAFVGLLFLHVANLFNKYGDQTKVFSGKKIWLRWSFYYVMILIIVVFGFFGRSEFIYFQF